jgi:hypothetical protein
MAGFAAATAAAYTKELLGVIPPLEVSDLRQMASTSFPESSRERPFSAARQVITTACMRIWAAVHLQSTPAWAMLQIIYPARSQARTRCIITPISIQVVVICTSDRFRLALEVREISTMLN